MNEFGGFVERIEALEDASAVIEEWHRSMNERFGPMRATYGYFIKGELPGRNQYFDTTFDSSYLDDYSARNRAADDLAYQFAEKGAGPFTWVRLLERGDWTRKQKAIFADCADAGMKVGMSASLFAEPGIEACFSAASEAHDFDMDHHMAEIYAMTCVAHRAHLELLARGVDPRHKFSDREREVFTQWARGKSVWEISEIVTPKISQATVKFHIANCYKKLGLNEKVPAVIKAVYTKQISLNPADIFQT